MSEHELWNELGNLYFLSGSFDQAVYAYFRSIQLDCGYGRPYSNLALAYVQQGKYEQAIELYRTSLELLQDDKDKALSWSRLGNVYRHLKKYQDAVNAYQKADELDPLNSESRDDPERLLYHSMDPESPETREALMQLVETEAIEAPDDLPPVVSAMEAPHLEVDSEQMEHGPVETMFEVPDLSTASDEPGATLELGESEELIAWAEPAMQEEDDPDLMAVFQHEPEVFYQDAPAETASDWLPIPEPLEASAEPLELVGEELAESHPDASVDPQPYFDFTQIPGQTAPLLAASVEVMRNELPEQKVQRADSKPQEPPSAFVMVEHPAAAFADLEEDTAAVRIEEQIPEPALNIELEIPRLKRLVQVNPQNAVTWNTLGNLYKFAGLYKEAILAYQQATSLDPEKSQYYHNLGMAYAAEGRDEDAIICLQRVLELNPEHSLTHATLGGYYRKMGLDELAQRHIGKAMKHIYDSESEYNRACLEAICGNTDQAIDLLRVALEHKQTYVDWVLRDPDLDTIRDDRRFKQLISDFT